jgi:hypothetical protein
MEKAKEELLHDEQDKPSVRVPSPDPLLRDVWAEGHADDALEREYRERQDRT